MVNPDMKKMQNVMRLLAILMIPLTSQLPAVSDHSVLNFRRCMYIYTHCSLRVFNY